MIKNFYPELSDKVSETVSPMCMLSRAIKAKYPEAVTVFIGPCIAKKSEIVDQKIEGNADYALAFSEIRAIMKAKMLSSNHLIILIRVLLFLVRNTQMSVV